MHYFHIYSNQIALLCLKGYLFVCNCLFYDCNLLLHMSHSLARLTKLCLGQLKTSCPSHLPSLISLRCLHKESLDHEDIARTQIRLGGSPG